MELESLRKQWQRQEKLGYDKVDLVEIFEARTRNIYSQMQSYLIKDLSIALGLTALFVAVLYFLNLKDFYFWTTTLVCLALGNTLLFSIQTRLLYRNLVFNGDVLQSLKTTRSNLVYLKTGSIALSTIVAGALSIYYFFTVDNTFSLATEIMFGAAASIVAGAIALLINKNTSSLFIKNIDEMIREMEKI